MDTQYNIGTGINGTAGALVGSDYDSPWIGAATGATIGAMFPYGGRVIKGLTNTGKGLWGKSSEFLTKYGDDIRTWGGPIVQNGPGLGTIGYELYQKNNKNNPNNSNKPNSTRRDQGYL